MNFQKYQIKKDNVITEGNIKTIGNTERNKKNLYKIKK